MKLKKGTQKLMLKKATIVNLETNEQDSIKGGATANLKVCATNVDGCDTSTCGSTGALYSCGGSLPWC